MTCTGNRLYIKVTNECNLKCPFCYSPNIKSKLTYSVVEKYIRSLNISDIIFHGGEPLLNIDLIEEIIDKTDKNFHIVTNFTLSLTERIKAIINTCGFATSYSVDRFTDSTINKWFNNIAYLHKINKEFTLIITLSEKQLQQDIYDLKRVIDKVNPSYISFERCHGNYNTDFYDKSDDYLCKISDLIDKQKNVNYIRFKNSIDNNIPCINYNCAKNTFTIDYRDKIYSCPSLCNESYTDSLRKECLLCDYYNYCRGDCPSFKNVCAFPKKFFQWVKNANSNN